MKYCSKCGKEVHDDAVVCVHCGCAIPSDKVEVDAPNMGFSVLGFLFPLIGLILYLIYKDTKPLQARSAGKGALIGVIVSAVIGVIAGIFYGALLGSLLYYY